MPKFDSLSNDNIVDDDFAVPRLVCLNRFDRGSGRGAQDDIDLVSRDLGTLHTQDPRVTDVLSSASRDTAGTDLLARAVAHEHFVTGGERQNQDAPPEGLADPRY